MNQLIWEIQLQSAQNKKMLLINPSKNAFKIKITNMPLVLLSNPEELTPSRKSFKMVKF